MILKWQLYRQLLRQYDENIEKIKESLNEKGIKILESQGFFDKANRRKSVIEKLCKINDALENGLDIGTIIEYKVKPHLEIVHIDGFDDVVWFHTKHGYYQLEKCFR